MESQAPQAVEKQTAGEPVTWNRKPSFPTEQELKQLREAIARENSIGVDDKEDQELLDQLFAESCISIFNNKSGWQKIAMILFPTNIQDYRVYALTSSNGYWKYVGQSSASADES